MLTVMKASNKCIKGIITILKVKSNNELTNYINLVCLISKKMSVNVLQILDALLCIPK
jgi:hypothetical protein